MKKAYFFANCHSSPGEESGGDRRFREIVKRIARFDKVIITSRFGFDVYKKEIANTKYFLTSEEKQKKNILLSYLIRTIKSLFLNLKLSDQDILYSNSDFLPDVLPAYLLKLKNKRVQAKWFTNVYHIIPHPLKRPGGFNLSNLLSFVTQRMSLNLVTKWSDMIFTENSFVKCELVRQYKISSKKIIVCPSGINPEVIDNFSWSGYKIYDACFLARLHKSKGIYDLIEAWKYVCRHDKNVKLAIAGNGPIKIVSEVKERIKNLHLENNVFYLGFLSEKDKYDLLKCSKLYVLPSYEEGIPITFYEAMYCNAAVVTYYLPTYKEIKDCITSVTMGDVKELADQIFKILNDKDLLSKTTERGRKEASEHTWDSAADCIFSEMG